MSTRDEEDEEDVNTFDSTAVKVKPVAGRLVVFRSTDRSTNGFCNPQSQHFSASVLPTVLSTGPPPTREDDLLHGETGQEEDEAEKLVVQKFYYQPTHRPDSKRRRGRQTQKSTSSRTPAIARALQGVLQPGQSYVLCDGSHSCRE